MKRQLGIFARGLAMGAADLVPGVSGGTVALITGIYDELLKAISSFDLSLVSTWKEGGAKAVWQQINGSFLAALALGIGTSIIALSGVLHYLLEHERIGLYSFFFGLVGTSIPLIGREVVERNVWSVGAFILGALITFSIGSLPPMTVTPGYFYLFFCGAIAACAMILPGISGSFILLLLGVYSHVIGAIKSLDVLTVMVVGAGAVSGLLGFSRLLKGWLEQSRNTIMALLSGLLLGSLQALWPWKENAILLYTHSDGRETWLQSNLWPELSELTTPMIWFAAGGLLVSGIQFVAERLKS